MDILFTIEFYQALLYMKYSTDSDVWSYGMVLFEIWSVGKKPFSQFSNDDYLEVIRNNTGYNQPPPPGCPRAIYQLMVNCWYDISNDINVTSINFNIKIILWCALRNYLFCFM